MAHKHTVNLNYDITEFAVYSTKHYWPTKHAFEDAKAAETQAVTQLKDTKAVILDIESRCAELEDPLSKAASGQDASPAAGMPAELADLKSKLETAKAAIKPLETLVQQRKAQHADCLEKFEAAKKRMAEIKEALPVNGLSGQLAWTHVKKLYSQAVKADSSTTKAARRHADVAQSMTAIGASETVLIDHAMNHFFVELIKNSFDAAIARWLAAGSADTLSVNIQCGFNIDEHGTLTFDYADDGPGFPEGFSKTQDDYLSKREYLQDSASTKKENKLTFGGGGRGINFITALVKEGVLIKPSGDTSQSIDLGEAATDIHFGRHDTMGGAQITIMCPAHPLKLTETLSTARPDPMHVARRGSPVTDPEADSPGVTTRKPSLILSKVLPIPGTSKASLDSEEEDYFLDTTPGAERTDEEKTTGKKVGFTPRK